MCWESGCFDYSNSVGKVAALTVASGAVGWQHTAVYGGKMDGSTVIATLFSAASGCCRML